MNWNPNPYPGQMPQAPQGYPQQAPQGFGQNVYDAFGMIDRLPEIGRPDGTEDGSYLVEVESATLFQTRQKGQAFKISFRIVQSSCATVRPGCLYGRFIMTSSDVGANEAKSVLDVFSEALGHPLSKQIGDWIVSDQNPMKGKQFKIDARTVEKQTKPGEYFTRIHWSMVGPGEVVQYAYSVDRPPPTPQAPAAPLPPQAPAPVNPPNFGTQAPSAPQMPQGYHFPGAQ